MALDVVRDALAAELASLGAAVATTPAAADGYGRDLVCFDDLTARLAETEPDGPEDLQQSAYHRITTRRGTVPDAPDYGRDVREYLHRATTRTQIEAAQGELANELRKDDRFAAVAVAITYTAVTRTMRVSVSITPANPQLQRFELLLVVTDAATILEAIS